MGLSNVMVVWQWYAQEKLREGRNDKGNTFQEPVLERRSANAEREAGVNFKRRGTEMNKWILPAVLLVPLAVTGCSHRTVVYAAPPPPAVLNQIAQRGFNDGFDAARRDVAQGRPPALERHPRFRNPPVQPPAFEDYRHGFREGYNAFLHQGPPPGSGY